MPTAIDVADRLPEVVAWIGAWEGTTDPEARDKGRSDSLEILNEIWQFLFGGEQIPTQKALAPEMLQVQLRSLKSILEKWDDYGEDERRTNRITARNILARAIAFFSA